MINKVIKENILQQAGVEYSDLIVSHDKFVFMINELNQMGYHIAEISWWQHKKIGDENSFSMGGPKDIINSDFYWAETNFSRNFSYQELKSNLKEVLEYYFDFSLNDKYNLFPAITLAIAFNNKKFSFQETKTD